MSSSSALWREGDYWTIRGAAGELRLKHSKGLGYLAALIARPGVDHHVLELAGAAGNAAPAQVRHRADVAELEGDDAAGAGPALDAQAKAAYSARVEELREELEQAREWRDEERAARAREELDAISDELARSVGLGGRDRPTASQAERARQSVGRAIRKAVRRIGAEDPHLGAHLERSVSTGAYCSYRPEPEEPIAVLPGPPEPASERSGTVVFMLTDVEGSTRLYEQQPDSAAAILAELADRVGELVDRSGGTTITERGEGDSTFSVFGAATDAVGCALELQRTLQAEGMDAPVALRVGLHAGEAERFGRDFHGVAVHRCSRLRDIAHGGQVLLSGAVAELAGEGLPAGAGLRDLGSHRLRDLERPEHVFQLVHRDIRSDFPPIRSADQSNHNLPPQLTSFVGRDRELGELAATAREARLVTLTGAGGAGKTRLAIELGRRLAGELAGGAWLVDLAPVSDPGMVAKALAKSIGVLERPQSPLIDDVVARLRGSEQLVVLDNCEHLAEESALIANELLQHCPELHLLATSREPLGVPGEIVRRVSSLTLPADDASVESVGEAEAVMLLRERAAAVGAAFELSPSTARLASRICRRLDGLPLAIELAAGRLAMLSLHDLAARLDDCFALLTGGTRTALPRQRTLEATVAWSYELLSDVQRLLFDRLSVFAGGWTLDAGQEVCAFGGLTERDVVDGLAILVEKSLVVRDALPEGRARYRLLETLRQYGRTRLSERDEAAPARDAHLTWVVKLSEQAEPQLWGLEQPACLERLEAELDNQRAALEWALASGDAESGLRILSIGVGGFWLWRGHALEARRLLAQLLDSPAAARTPSRTRGLIAAGRLAFQTGAWEEGMRRCEEAIELARASGDAVGEARALIWQGVNLIGDESRRDHQHVTALLEETLDAARRSGGAFEMALAAGAAGMWWADIDIERARKLADEAGRLIEEVPSPNWLAHTHEFRAYVAHLEGDEGRASELLGAALPLYLQIGNHSCGAHCLESAALLTAGTGRAELAAELLGAAGRLREEVGTVPPSYEEQVRRRGAELIGESLSGDALTDALERGRDLAFEAAIERASAAISRG